MLQPPPGSIKGRRRRSSASPGRSRRRTTTLIVEDLESRLVMSAGPISGLPASAAQVAAESVEAAPGVKQLVVETWNNEPYLFMINSDDELYFGRLTPGPKTASGDTSAQFSGWTFLSGSARKVAVDLWNDHPYVYMIDTSGSLLYGSLDVGEGGSNSVVGWRYLAWGVKDVAPVVWDGVSYLYVVNTNDQLFYGALYDASTQGGSGAAFGGWTYMAADVRTIDATLSRNLCLVFMIDANEGLNCGYMTLPTAAPPTPAAPASFSGWGLVTSSAKQLVVPHDSDSQNGLTIYTSFTDDMRLYKSYVSIDTHTAAITFEDWRDVSSSGIISGEQPSAVDWADAPVFANNTPSPVTFWVDPTGALFYGFIVRFVRSWDNMIFDDFVKRSISDDSRQVVTLSWQGDPYVFRVDSAGNLSYGDVYASSDPKNQGGPDQVAFSGWSEIVASRGGAPAPPSSPPPVAPGSTTAPAAPTSGGDGETHVPLGGGAGVGQLVVETWNDEPYLFMINTNDELYYGHMTGGDPDSATFSGWTFVTGSARKIAVGLWNDRPYVSMIDTAGRLYLGSIRAGTGADSTPEGEDAFVGWTPLAWGVKDVQAVNWRGDSYLYVTNTDDQLFYGALRAASAGGGPSATLGGWTFLAGGVKSIDVVQWVDAQYLFMTDADNDLSFGRLKTVSYNGGEYTAFGGWTFMAGAVKSVAVDVWQNAPYIYLIDELNHLYYGHLFFDPSTNAFAAGRASFSGWTFVLGAAKTISVQEQSGTSVLYLTNLKDHAYQGVQFASQDSPVHDNVHDAGFTGWYAVEEQKQVMQFDVDNRDAGTYYFTVDAAGGLSVGHVKTVIWDYIPRSFWVWEDL